MNRIGVTSACVLALTASASAQFRPVALEGDPVPGQAGVTLERTIDVAALGGNRAVYRAKTSNNHDIIAIDDGSGTDIVIAIAMQPAPGGSTYGQLSNPIASGSAFAFKSTNGGVETVFAWSAATGVRRVIASGDVLPTTRTLGTALQVKLNVLGQIAVTNYVDTVVVEPNGTVRGIAHVGGPVPGDTGRTIISPMGNVWLSDTGDLTFSVAATGYTYVLHGPPGNITLVESNLSHPNMTGDVGLVAASRSGLIAYFSNYSTDTAGPTVTHHVLEIGAAGATTEVMHLMDTTTFMVGGRTVQTNYVTSVLHPTTGLVTKTNVGIVRNSGGAWSKIHFNDEGLPGMTMAQPLEIDTLGADGTLILTGGVGASSAIYRWTSSGVLELVVKAGDAFTGIGTLTAVGASESAVSADGQTAIVVGYNDGQNRSGGYLSGSPGAATDLVLTEARAPLRGTGVVRGVDRSYTGNFALRVENRGPAAVAPDLSFVNEAGMFEVTGCSSSAGPCACTGNVCSISRVLAPGEALDVSVGGDMDDEEATITIAVSGLLLQELVSADNVLVLTIPRRTPSDPPRCSVGGGSGSVLVGLALATIVLRRRRRR